MLAYIVFSEGAGQKLSVAAYKKKNKVKQREVGSVELCQVEKLCCYLCAGLQVEKCLLLPHLLSPRSGGISPTLGETHVPSGSRGVTAALLWGSEQPPAPGKQQGAGPMGTPAGLGADRGLLQCHQPNSAPSCSDTGMGHSCTRAACPEVFSPGINPLKGTRTGLPPLAVSHLARQSMCQLLAWHRDRGARDCAGARTRGRRDTGDTCC